MTVLKEQASKQRKIRKVQRKIDIIVRLKIGDRNKEQVRVQTSTDYVFPGNIPPLVKKSLIQGNFPYYTTNQRQEHLTEMEEHYS